MPSEPRADEAVVDECPSCGGKVWIIPSSVEVELTFEGHFIRHVRVTENEPIRGEGDIRCAGCGELLLDWGSRVDDDAAWAKYHDDRRPLWDALQLDAALGSLPPFGAWERAEAQTAQSGSHDDPSNGLVGPRQTQNDGRL